VSKDEKSKLKTLLGYGIEHNREHSLELTEWVEKAKAMGEEEVASEIRQAIEQMDKVTVLLAQSLKKLGGKGR
jgi:coproporphyrinogen III oxidase-like Fe-S oxidoreductase